MPRTIFHIDMDAFFASVEQATHPELRGKPIVVCGDPKSRTAIAAASYEARKHGVRAGMNLYEARKLCPGIIPVRGDSDKYVSTSLQIIGYLASITPYVEVYSVDEAFLDVTGAAHLYGGPMETARRIKEWIRSRLGLTCSIGIAPNKLLAKIASDVDKPDGIFVLREGDVKEFMETLDLSDVPGIGKRTEATLHRFGIRTCGALGRFPEKTLKLIFGINGEKLHRMGLGEDTSPVLPHAHEEETKSMGHSLTLRQDTLSLKELKRYLLQLSEQVGRRLRRDRFRGKTVTLVLRYTSFHTHTFSRRRTLCTYLDDGREIFRAAASILDDCELLMPVRLIGVSVSTLVQDLEQLSLYRNLKDSLFTKAVDEVNNKYGEFTLAPGTLLYGRSRYRIISPSWRPSEERGYDQTRNQRVPLQGLGGPGLP
jgi:DNA polymerase-4